jgi:hypothetical protein
MDVVEKKLKLDRRGLVTMALLCGCDYLQDGVHDVGIVWKEDHPMTIPAKLNLI